MPSTTDPTAVLARARRVLAHLEAQAAGFGALHVPAHLQIELEEKRREVAALEARLAAPDAGDPVAPLPTEAVDLTALRALVQRLDVIEIESLCLDHFPAVYDKFGRGLQRGEMVNLLLDHVRRRPEEAPRLAGLLSPAAPPPVRQNPGGGRGVVAENPFTPLTGRVTAPAWVFDRDRELRRVVEFLQAGSSVALIGPAAVGKSSLLTRLVAELPERLGVPWETAYLDLQPIYNEEEFFAALCDALGVAMCRGYPLHSALRERRIVLAVDEVDKMAWEGFSRSLRTELRGLASDGAAPLKLLLAARQPLDLLFPDSEGDTSPLANICLQVDVGPWDEATVRAFLMARLETAGVTFTEAEIARLVAASGGYPQRLVQAAYALFAQKAAL